MDNLHLEYFGASDIGLVRKENQDSFGKYPSDSDDRNQPKGLLFIVADGMGGHVGGKEASKSAVEIVSQEYYSFSSSIVANCLKYAIKTANFRIHQSSRSEVQAYRKGTTCSAFVIEKDLAYIAHVGDSRIYRINNDEIEQLTVDHTQVEEMLRKGILSKEEAENHPSKSILVRALGIEPDVEIDVLENIKIKPNDNFVLCSDGLTKVSTKEIKGIVLSNSPEDACNELIRLANDRGGHDNVTVQIIRVKSTDGAETIQEPETAATKSGSRQQLVLIILILIALITTTIIFQDKILGLFKSETDLVNDVPADLIVRDKVGDYESLLHKAERFMVDGKLDSAVYSFNLILKDNPMHVGAFNGMDLIASEYIRFGNLQRDNKNYNEALFYYQKAAEIKPADKNIAGLIAFSKREIKNEQEIKSKTEYESQNNELVYIDEQPVIKESEMDDNIIFAAFTPSDWNFGNLSENDFKINNQGLIFFSSSKVKMGLYNQKMEDVDINVNLILSNESSGERAGIIIGYDDGSNVEQKNYFMFSADAFGNFWLLKNNNGSEEKLVSVYRKVNPIQDKYNYKLKIKSLGPWIMIYNDDKLLDSWLGKDFVNGKIGLFAESGTHAEFSEFKVTTAFEKK